MPSPPAVPRLGHQVAAGFIGNRTADLDTLTLYSSGANAFLGTEGG